MSATHRAHHVVLRIPPSAGYVTLLRTVVGTCAGHRDFTLDQVDDLRMAVDEVAGQLLRHVAGGELELSVADTDRALEIRLSAETAAERAVIDRESFAWTILQVLTDELDVVSEDQRTVITLRLLPEVSREERG